MKIELAHRRYGLHDLVGETEIPGEFGDYATPRPDEVRDEEYTIAEDKLLAAIPGGFLPVPPRQILLCTGDKDWSTGQSNLSLFRSWAKYFDAYVLTLAKPDPEPAPKEG